MDWIQVLTIVATTVGSLYVFYNLTSDRMSRIEDRHLKNHEDHRNDMKNMDEKWERLFERLLLQDKKQ